MNQYDLFDQAVEELKQQQAPPAAPSLLDTIRNTDQRFFTRMYLRSNMDADQDIARARCELYGIDYAAAYQEVQREQI